MRLFGRGESDYGHAYAEARITTLPVSKKRRSSKEATLFFFGGGENEDKDDMDAAYLCATWWCARQTYDEGQVAAAHAEIEMIENIEKAFEVDLLAGA